jgi:hypothetical protein
MLIWHKELWLIDHGASLYMHHSWHEPEKQALMPFKQIKDHVLLPYAGKIDEANRTFKRMLSEEALDSIVSKIPQEWLVNEGTFSSGDDQRNAYLRFLTMRLANSDIFLNEALHAREALI